MFVDDLPEGVRGCEVWMEKGRESGRNVEQEEQ
jgi:hypothetical protein